MVLTAQHQKDVWDIIRESFNDKQNLSMLRHTVTNLVIDELDEKWNSLKNELTLLKFT